MANSSEITDRISALRIEAATAGDDAQVRICDRILAAGIVLYDSDTKELVEPGDDASIADYCDVIVASFDCEQPEGSVLYRGHTIYAE